MQHGIIAWLVIGAIAGWLAGKVVEGAGFGLIIDIVVGILGAVIGGYLAGALGIAFGGGLISSIIVAVIGAVILLVVLRFIKRAGSNFPAPTAGPRRKDRHETLAGQQVIVTSGS